ncbi:DNA repair protein RecO [Bacillus sp. EAC]|uniref:DNA repair protein RecO n=1 Tax=Bacillus sp. EAC TaxID=1978338 RepID=UPI000B43B49D|nr:DNA repair protein RecO [Bacillus sp. EAC]
MLQRVEGIVLRANPYGESNVIITLLTRELGKIGVVARGAKKTNSRLASVTQLFTYGSFLIQKGSGLGTLSQGELIDSFRDVRGDLFATSYASIIVELTDKAIDEKKNNPYLFELVLQLLQHMNEGADAEVLAYLFMTKMIPVLGYPPFFDNCINCRCSANENVFVAFSVKEGGFLCQRCKHTDPYAYPVSEKSVKLMRLFYHFDVNRLGKIEVSDQTKKNLQQILFSYYDEYSGIYLKARKFLDQLKVMDNFLKSDKNSET